MNDRVKHAGDGMVGIRFLTRSSPHDRCMTMSLFHVEGIFAVAECRKHAVSGMVNVVHKVCCRHGCSSKSN